MSYRSGHYSDHPHHHGHAHARMPPRCTAPARPRPDPHGYTIVHAGRQVRFGPVVFWIVAGSIILMGAWSAATATYFAFRDDVLTRLIARQAEMQYGYEDRIAELRARVDRTTTGNCSIRSSTTRSSARSCGAKRCWNPAPQRWRPPTGRRHRSVRPTSGRSAAERHRPFRHAEALADRRHRDFHSRRPTAKRASNPARPRLPCRARNSPDARRRQRAAEFADRARQGRKPADRGAHLGRGKQRIAGAPHAR